MALTIHDIILAVSSTDSPLSPRLLEKFRAIVGSEGLLASPAARYVYECDGYTLEKAIPEVVLLPRTTEEVRQCVRVCSEAALPFVPRGAGTGLSGGCLPLAAPVMIGTSRMRSILSIDLPNRRLIAQAGVVNLAITEAVREAGYYYPPDPSSQSACTIGGNVAENSGGPHTLKYGVTTNHLLGVKLVLPDGAVVSIGGEIEDMPGYDLLGLVVGCEGTFGIVTEVTVRLARQPPATRTLLAVFNSVDEATAAVSAIIAAGVIPAAIEMMDKLIIEAVEAAYHFGFPTDAGAVLIVELEGLEIGVAAEVERVLALLKQNRAREVSSAANQEEREALWRSRKRAFGAVGRLAPNYCTQDGVVPRTQLPEILRRIKAIGSRHRLRIANVFHAGDGNIHPILLYDERDTDQVRRVIAAGREILRECVALGGSLTGEHGIGVEKSQDLKLLFSDVDLACMQAIRHAFDPGMRSNPGKIFPTPGACVETLAPRKQAPA